MVYAAISNVPTDQIKNMVLAVKMAAYAAFANSGIYHKPIIHQ